MHFHFFFIFFCFFLPSDRSFNHRKKWKKKPHSFSETLYKRSKSGQRDVIWVKSMQEMNEGAARLRKITGGRDRGFV